MTKNNAFWRLFPAVLFTSLGLLWCCIWRLDPVLLVIALCITAFAGSWLVITIVAVARMMEVTDSPAKTASSALL